MKKNKKYLIYLYIFFYFFKIIDAKTYGNNGILTFNNLNMLSHTKQVRKIKLFIDLF